jgi:hypothetical protein
VWRILNEGFAPILVLAIGGGMSALPRPALPAGAQRDLVAALHDLHHRSGWPSLRVLAREAGVSHTTVSKVFSAPALPAWGTLELLVEAMHGDTAAFHALWLDASVPARQGPQHDLRIAGRRIELAVVRHHLEVGTGLLLVAGEAGIGKTTLIEAATAGSDFLVATGHCLSLSTEVPFLPVVEALRSVLDRDGQGLERALGECPGYVRSTLAGLVPELDMDAAQPDPDDPSGRQRIFVSFTAALRSLTSSSPIGLLIEDLHWADTGTLDLVEHLLNTPMRLAIIGTWRLNDVNTSPGHIDWFERQTRKANVGQLELTPLSEDETALQLRLLGVDLHGDLAGRVHARTQGQPLFTEQLATQLGDETPLPRVLGELLDRRFDGISEAAWSITRALGVADRPLTAAHLAAATGLAPAHLTEELRELQRRRIVRTTRLGAADLQHPLLAEATRRRLVAGEAREVHRALAETLGADQDASAAEVAAHWEGASDTEHELEWRVAAARSASTKHAVAAEAQQWLRALQIWPPDRVAAGTPAVTRAQAYLAAMDALKFSMQFDRAAQMSDDAADRLSVTDPATRAELLQRAALFRGAREGMEVGLAMVDEAIAAYEALPVSAGMVRALLGKHTLLLNDGRYAEAFAVAHAATQAAKEIGHARLHREALNWVAWHEGVGGSSERAAQTMARAASLVPSDTDPIGDINQAMLLTDMLLLNGRGADAIDAAGNPGLAVADRWQIDSSQALLVRSNMTWGRIRQGRVTQAAALVDAWTDGSVDIDRWSVHLDRAVLDCLRGHEELALHRTAALLAGLESRSVVTELDFVHALATIFLWSGAPEEAWTRLVPSLNAVLDWTPAGLTRVALLQAARAGADTAETSADAVVAQRHLATLMALRGRVPVDDDSQAYNPQRLPAAYSDALAAGLRAELDRLSGTESVEHWVIAADKWEVLTRPHDAAYYQWRAAQVALDVGRGTVAAKLLNRAAIGAREHVPLQKAIARTAGTVPDLRSNKQSEAP